MSDEDHGGERERPASRQDLAEVMRALEALTERVAGLERHVGKPRSAAAKPTYPTEPPAPPPPPRAPKPPSKEKPTPVIEPVSARAPSPAWQVGPLRKVGKENLPVVLLGAVGGLALLVGVLYFAWYSIQQGWISPRVRLIVSGAFGVLGLAAAWWLAPRGQRSVAAALGGAGLGACFGACYVARHGHFLLGPTSTFVLLVLAAAAGLLIAAHRELRFLAILAAIGAFLAPLLVGSETERFHELMAYQLVVVLFLYVLEDRRRWPELGHFANSSTWFLILTWVSWTLPGSSREAVIAWSFAYLVLGQAQAWILLRRGRLAAGHAAPRLWVHAYLAWFAAMSAAQDEHFIAHVSIGMALLNAGTAWTLLRTSMPEAGKPARSKAWVACIGGCSSVAWLQLFVAGPLRLDDEWVLVWWTAMASVAAAFHVWRAGVTAALALVLPFAASVIHSLEVTQAPTAWLGFLVAALPIAIALWPDRETLATPRPWRDRYLSLLMILGSLVWAAMAWEHFENALPREGWFVLVCLVAGGVLSARAITAPSSARCTTTLGLLAALVVASLLVSEDTGLFRPGLTFRTERLWQFGALLGVAGLAIGFGAAFPPHAAQESGWRARVFDTAGLLRAFALVVVAMLLVTGLIPSLTTDWVNARSLNQAGWSVCWAVAGLSLLVRGLFRQRTLWRRAGLLLLFATAAKLVVVDLTHVSVVWRVLSFVGLGCCMLVGAYTYRRLSSSLERGRVG